MQISFDEWFDVMVSEGDSMKDYIELEDMYYNYISEQEDNEYDAWKDNNG